MYVLKSCLIHQNTLKQEYVCCLTNSKLCVTKDSTHHYTTHLQIIVFSLYAMYNRNYTKISLYIDYKCADLMFV